MTYGRSRVASTDNGTANPADLFAKCPRDTDDVTRHVSTFESQLIDDQEQKLGVKDIGLFFDEFRVGDAWGLTDHDGSRGECRRPELAILMVPWNILSSH